MTIDTDPTPANGIPRSEIDIALSERLESLDVLLEYLRDDDHNFDDDFYKEMQSDVNKLLVAKNLPLDLLPNRLRKYMIQVEIKSCIETSRDPEGIASDLQHELSYNSERIVSSRYSEIDDEELHVCSFDVTSDYWED